MKTFIHMISVGINYSGDYKLFGCHNDVDSLKKVLYVETEERSLGEYHSLKDDPGYATQPTFENISSLIQHVYKSAKKGDLVIFTFSGHGGQISDKNKEEKDGKDECIYDSNLKEISDDQLYKILVEELPREVKLFVLLDCCHSGTGLDLPWLYRPYIGKEIDSKNSTSKEVYCISGCCDSQTSADAWIDRKPQGALTAHFCSLVNENLKLRWKDFITLLHYNVKKSGYEQSPVLSYSHSSLIDREVNF